VKIDYQLEEAVNFAVFPSLQGGPHVNTIAAIAVALKEVKDISFTNYAKQVILNAQAFAKELSEYDIVTKGTDNHIILWNLKKLGLTGSKMEKILEYVSISVNKNAVFGDTSALVPGGIRIGSRFNFKRNERRRL